MPITPVKQRVLGAIIFIAIIVAAVGIALYDLRPVYAGDQTPVVFEIKQGDGFRTIINNLYGEHLIRSPFVVELFSFIGGRAFAMKPGLYRLNAGMSASEIVTTIAGKNATEVSVTIPEGSNIYDIDKILSKALVIRSGALISLSGASSLEGKLFPDTYNFYTGINVNDVVRELMDNFNVKAVPLLDQDKNNFGRNLVLASLVQKEVPDVADEEIVAGILLKRANAGMTLNVDATICYAKFQAQGNADGGCYPLSPLDFRIRSPYNTYLNKGLPESPIGNPGIAAITATLHPKSSPYWYYLSDPKTGKTIYARTLGEQNINRIKYLGQ